MGLFQIMVSGHKNDVKYVKTKKYRYVQFMTAPKLSSKPSSILHYGTLRHGVGHPVHICSKRDSCSGFDSSKEKQNYQSKETKTKEATNNNMQKATEKKKTLACSLTDLVKYLTWTFLLYYRPLLQTIVKSGKSFFSQ